MLRATCEEIIKANAVTVMLQHSPFLWDDVQTKKDAVLEFICDEYCRRGIAQHSFFVLIIPVSFFY